MAISQAFKVQFKKKGYLIKAIEKLPYRANHQLGLPEIPRLAIISLSWRYLSHFKSDYDSVTRILNFGPNTNTNIFVMQNFTEYEYRIYSFLANLSNTNIEYIRS